LSINPELNNAGRALMEEMLADPRHEYRAPQFGDVIDGTVMSISRDEMLVDIGAKSEGVVTAREFSTLTDDEFGNLAVGAKVLVFVTQPESQDGVIGLSLDRARQEKSWRRLQELYEAGEMIDAEVVNYNKGGLLVNLDGVRGFVPASQVTEITTGDEAAKQAEMARLVGRSLQLKIIEINRNRNRLILSERQALQEKRDVMKERLIEELTEGEVRKGRVSSICDFGAFVDVGGADGLVHLSELSWSRVRHPSELLKIGQDVDVYVLGINAEERKIALSIKRTQPEPWSWVANKYDVDQLVRGTVTQLANFGAFARIEDGIEGLVHVSELSDARVGHPRQMVSEGQELILKIIRIDPQRRRMGLSLRKALESTDEEVEAALGADAIQLKRELEALEIEPDPADEYQMDERDDVTVDSSADTIVEEPVAEPAVETDSEAVELVAEADDDASVELADVGDAEADAPVEDATVAAVAEVAAAQEVAAEAVAVDADDQEPPAETADGEEAEQGSSVETAEAEVVEVETADPVAADATPVQDEEGSAEEAEETPEVETVQKG
jgi:small subunit ribosomal protein S1